MTDKTNSPTSSNDEVPEELRKVADDVHAGTARTATVRELLAWFDAKRRGHFVVLGIREALKQVRIRTDPDFEDEYIDNQVQFLDDTPRRDPIRSVRSIPTANKPEDLITINPNKTVAEAATLMIRHNYSQLPVIRSDELQGMISWRSIGCARAGSQDCERVEHCLEQPVTVTLDTPLLEAVERIAKHDVVLVMGVQKDKRKLTGIVTATDLSLEFQKLAEPFLLLEEIEKQIRRLLEGKFRREELNETVNDTPRPKVKGIDDLTFGGYHQLLGKAEHWERLNVDLDRKQFRKLLDDVRRIRNEIMHFSVDELDAQQRHQLHGLKNVLRCMIKS